MTAAQQKRVLVVDDDAVTRELLGFSLRRRSLTVDEARDGHEALALMKNHQYAVIVLDLLMPGLDGAGVLAGMDGPDLTSPPVVLVITAADRREIARLDPRRIHGIMRKPFDPEDLEIAVSRALNADEDQLDLKRAMMSRGASLYGAVDKMRQLALEADPMDKKRRR